MDDYKDFTYDKFNFSGLPELIDDLHKDNKHYIPIVDAGIA
jgi:alpha-glucosidase (family GH31 glycosyl hydrolase)